MVIFFVLVDLHNGSAFAAMASIIGTIIVLPKTIAEHLFPAAGEEKEIEMIKAMQKFDSNKTPDTETISGSNVDNFNNTK